MAFLCRWPVPLLFDFNVVITNLNKMDKTEALELVSALRRSIQSSAESNEGHARELQTFLGWENDLMQQQLLYRALLEWLDHLKAVLKRMSTRPQSSLTILFEVPFGSAYMKELITVSTRYVKSLLVQSPKTMRSMSFC